MLTTNQPLIHAHFVSVIESITPNYEGYNECYFKYVEELPGEVSSNEIRVFTLNFSVAEPVENGLFSLGEEYAFDMEINIAYGGLPKEHAPWLITQDSVQLRTILLAQLAPTLEGLLSVRRIQFTPVSDEDGYWYGYHLFRIHYMHDTEVSIPPIV